MDEKKTYIIGVIGAGEINDKYQKFQPCAIPERERWVHVAALFYIRARPFGWRVIDCDRPCGVRERSLSLWLHENGRWPIVAAFEHCLSVPCLREYVGRPFSMSKVTRLRHYPMDRGVPKVAGLTCSELIAKCDGREPINPSDIRAVDYQIWAKENKKKLFDVRQEFCK